ncbi:uncharacterized protein PG986_014127 [Apiospora aurea]|uniref:Uncharacterized protein n=1 Tax=Apiospora aurea TaxID=335848 RepID=A0ABR1PS38_9PEZI
MSAIQESTRRRENLSFEDIAGEYRIFIQFGNLTGPVEVVHHKEENVLYVPGMRGNTPSSQKIGVISSLEGPVGPRDGINIRPHSNPYGFRLFNETCDLMAYVPEGMIWISTGNLEVKSFEPDPDPYYKALLYGNFVEEVDLETGHIVARVNVPYGTTPIDERSGLLQFNMSQNTGPTNAVPPGPRPLIANAQADPVASRIRNTFHTNRIHIMPKEVMLA